MLIEARRESIFIDLDHQSHGKTESMNSRIQQGQGPDLLLVMHETVESSS